MFTQTAFDKDDRQIRDPDSTTYFAAIESAEESGLRLFTEAWRRGWVRARQKVLHGDRAVRILTLDELHFPGTVQIVDLYRAHQHTWELAAKLFAAELRARRRWGAICPYLLDQGKIVALLTILRHPRPDHQRLAAAENDAATSSATRNAYATRSTALRGCLSEAA